MASPRDHKLGIWMTSGLVVGSMIGSGIFMLPVSLAPLGANTLIAWPVSIAGAIAIAFALASLRLVGPGGIRASSERAFGPTIAFVTTWAFWWSNLAAQAALAIATASALSSLVPMLAGGAAIVAVAVSSVVFLTLVNLRGVRTSGGLSLLTVAIKLLPLFAVVALVVLRGFAGVPFQPLANSPTNLSNVASATALTLFALTGFENAVAAVDKVRDASRILPRALLGGTAFVGLVYLLSSSGVMLMLPADQITRSPAPYADVIAAGWGAQVGALAAAAIAVSAFGALNCLILGTGELAFAMGLRADLPHAMSRTCHEDIPFVAHAVGGVLTIFLIVANSTKATASLFTFVILLSTAAILVVYAVGAVAAWNDNRSVGRRVVISAALLFILFAFYGAGLEADLWCALLIVCGLGLRTVVHASHARAAAKLSSVLP